jgi:hypothetical protein
VASIVRGAHALDRVPRSSEEALVLDAESALTSLMALRLLASVAHPAHEESGDEELRAPRRISALARPAAPGRPASPPAAFDGLLESADAFPAPP